ncbi:MAG: response regulator [Deltaproteobacteria bacterium]|nr:MAG: response regulator [Deltaproteobacteria bacterium]
MARILVIDDDEASRAVIEEILARKGHEVTLAGGGRAGLAEARRQRFDLVLVDIIMPDIDGMETITELREMSDALPIIAMSGSSPNSAGYLETAKVLGADAALAKPFTKSELEDAVAAMLAVEQRARGSL